MRSYIREIFEKISRLGRHTKSNENENIVQYSNQLKDQGYIILDHLVGTKKFESIKNKLIENIEMKCNFEFPCLSQNKISPTLDEDLINKNFLCTNEELKARDLTFENDNIRDYKHMIEKYNPATLTIPMIPDQEYYDIWLDDIVMEVVKEFMGFTPHMIEAYSRRNFPSKFSIMNHNWHRDSNHKHFLLKAFIFFTDCDLETGAHQFIAGSVHQKKFTERRYYSDEEIDNAWPISSKARIISKVPAGTIIIEDTRGLHKAGIPLKKFRDLGYAVFVPVNFINKPKSYYNLPKKVYEKLSSQQRYFIPKQNII